MPWKKKIRINDYMTALSKTEEEGEIQICGDIATNKFWDEDVTPTSIRDALNDFGDISTLNLHINSLGGNVFAGNAIIDILDFYREKTGCKINAYIDGIAASMGSCIPMVADKIYMAENALIMIHKPYTLVSGNADDLEKGIEMLQKAEHTLIVNYMRRFKGTEEELAQMLADETWLTADEAKELGFCDEIVPAVKVAASARGITINGEYFRDTSGIAARFTPNVFAKVVQPQQGKKKEGDSKVFVYDEKLGSEYGITKETFDSLNMSAQQIQSVIDAFSSSVCLSSSSLETADVFITHDTAMKALGSDCSADQVLSFAKAGMGADEKANEKAKEYDKIVSTAIEDALKNGVRAKGEAFNEDRWRKIFSCLDYADIIAQSEEWADEAKKELHAGKRSSSVQSNITNFNPDNYAGL